MTTITAHRSTAANATIASARIPSSTPASARSRSRSRRRGNPFPLRAALLIPILALCTASAARAGGGNAHIKTDCFVMSEGIDITVNGRTLGRLHFFHNTAEQQAQFIAEWIDAFGGPGVHAQVDRNDPTNVQITGAQSLGVRSDNGSGCRDYHLDPPPPVRGSYAFTPGYAAGVTYAGARSALEFYLNAEVIKDSPAAGETVPALLGRIAKKLYGLGYSAYVSANGLQLYALQMPDGAPITEIGWWTNDVALEMIAPLLAFRVVGDMNCDGAVDFADIDPFVLALSDPAGYQAAFPDCDVLSADINGDSVVNFEDIDPFVALLSGG